MSDTTPPGSSTVCPTSPASTRGFRVAIVVAYVIGLALVGTLEYVFQAGPFEDWRAGRIDVWPIYEDYRTLRTLLVVSLPLFWLAQRSMRLVFGVAAWAVRHAGRLVRHDAAFATLAFLVPVTLGVVFRTGYFRDFAPEDVFIHDEASYLFQAKTFLAGRLSFPSPPEPEFFDSFHMVNQGRMASRYFPGTGLVLAPFVVFGAPWLCHVLLTGLLNVAVFLIGLELGDRRAARLAALLCGVAPAVLTFGQILEAHLPTAVPLLFGVLFFLRTLRRDGLADPILAGVGLALAMLARPLTAFGVAVLPAVWFLVQVASTGRRSGWARLLAMATPVGLGLALLAGYSAAITGDPLHPPYVQYTETYSPRHRYGFFNGYRAWADELPITPDGKPVIGRRFPRRDHQRKFVAYDNWSDNLDMRIALIKLRMRAQGMGRGTLGTGLCAMALVTVLLTFRAWGAGDRLVLAGIVGLHGIHVPFAFEGIDWVGYVFESAPLMCLVLARVLVALFDTARADRREWLVVWAASACVGMAAENLAGWMPDRCAEIARTRRYYKAFREGLALRGVRDRALVFIKHNPEHLHRCLVFNDPGLTGPVLRAWHADAVSDARCVRHFPNRRCFIVEEATRDRPMRVAPLLEELLRQERRAP